MKIEIDPESLRPVIRAIVAEVLEQLATDQAPTGDAMSLTEADAARALGVPWYSLRDARRRGEITGAKVGRRVVYTRQELERFLAARKNK